MPYGTLHVQVSVCAEHEKVERELLALIISSSIELHYSIIVSIVDEVSREITYTDRPVELQHISSSLELLIVIYEQQVGVYRAYVFIMYIWTVYILCMHKCMCVKGQAV